jgi:hypothetical protein
MKWTKETSESVIKFLNEKSHAKRGDIFKNELLEPIETIIDTVYKKYKGKYEYEEFKQNVTIHVYECLTNYKLEKLKNGEGSPLSYIRVIARSYNAKYVREDHNKKKYFIPIEKHIEENHL